MAETAFTLLDGLLLAGVLALLVGSWAWLHRPEYVPDDKQLWDEWLETLVLQRVRERPSGYSLHDFSRWVIDYEIEQYKAAGYAIVRRPVMRGLLRREVRTRRKSGHAVLMEPTRRSPQP